jgi:cation:H+ antiporter
VRQDVPIMIAVSAGVWLLAANGRIGRGEGAILCAAMALYTVMQIALGRRAEPGAAPAAAAETPQPTPGPRALLVSGVLVLAGLALLTLGGRWLVGGAVDLARLLGAGDLLIALTIVAGGTSAPEAATSILATVRGQREIAVGNIVGSNIFNLLGVLGVAAMVRAAPVSGAALRFDMPIMVAAALACLPIFFTGGRISRGEGAVFVGYYGAYLTMLILSATGHAGARTFAVAMLAFVIPLTALGLIASVILHRRRTASRA